MSKQQRSKRSRNARKKTEYLGLPTWLGHRSHVSGRRFNRYHRPLSQRFIQEILDAEHPNP